MGETESKEAKTEGNSNSNDITIVQEIIAEHSGMVKILLVIIVIILSLFAICKVYAYQKKINSKENIKKIKRCIRRVNLKVKT